MAFVSSFTGLSVSAASPTHRMVSSRRANVHIARKPRMSMVGPVASDVAVKAHNVLLVAVKDGDFGGYIGPIVGLLIIGIIIAVLTPPVKE